MKDRTIKLQCPTCERHLKVPNPKPNKTIVCPRCNARFRVDANLRFIVERSKNELFGPPVDKAIYDEALVLPPGEIRAAFEDIDHLFASGDHLKPDDSLRQADLPRITINANRDDRDLAGVEATTKTQRPENNSSPAQSPGDRWAAQKSTMSRSDERVQRNGIGLLILATGLAALPFFGRSVDGLENLLPWMPWTAVVVAFVGSFMLAFSMRRGKLGPLMLAMFPLLLIALISTGGHFYQTLWVAENQVEEVLEALGIDGKAMQDGLDRFNRDNGIAFDPDSIVDNAAAKFVPPRHEKPLVADNRPVVDNRPSASHNPADLPLDSRNSGKSDNPASQPAEAQKSPVAASPVAESPNVESPIGMELKRAENILANTAKSDHLQKRIEKQLTKGLVDRDSIRSPIELRSNYFLSKTAGKQSVYGSAIFNSEPISGFDVVWSAGVENRQVNLIVPIIDAAEFPDSIAAADRDAKLTGLYVHFQDSRIVGLLGQFLNTATGEYFHGTWFGRPATSDGSLFVDAQGQPIHGIVMYRNQFELVGIALVLGKLPASAK